jgi:protoheme IX farnesyltransferase
MQTKESIALSKSTIWVDYIRLMKPELTLLSVMTAMGSAYLALRGSANHVALIHTFFGTILIGGAAGVLNQYIERNYDALMKRTERRPLPSGRVRPIDALVFGTVLAASGILYLSLAANYVAGTLAVLTLVLYLFVYTPLKRKTPFATVIGALPGAFPPLIGWAVVRGSVSMEAWSLFFILFFWQMPHFLSLAWLYRKDYACAGYQVMTVLDPTGSVTGRQIVVYSIALIPASLMPSLVGLTGLMYAAGAFVLSTVFLTMAIWLYREKTQQAARRLFLTSLVFLSFLFPLLMIA